MLASGSDIIDILARDKEENLFLIDMRFFVSKVPEHQGSLYKELAESCERLSFPCGNQAS